jgi:hypothetical protein
VGKTNATENKLIFAGHKKAAENNELFSPISIGPPKINLVLVAFLWSPKIRLSLKPPTIIMPAESGPILCNDTQPSDYYMFQHLRLTPIRRGIAKRGMPLLYSGYFASPPYQSPTMSCIWSRRASRGIGSISRRAATAGFGGGHRWASAASEWASASEQ